MIDGKLEWSDKFGTWVYPEGLREECFVADGVGTIDCIRSHGFFHRLAIRLFGRWMEKNRITTCNPSIFHRGETLKVYSALRGKPRGEVVVQGVSTKHLRFETILPEGTRRGDLVIRNG